MVIICMGRFVIISLGGRMEVSPVHSRLDAPMTGQGDIHACGESRMPVTSGAASACGVRIACGRGTVIEIARLTVDTQIEPTVTPVTFQPQTGLEAVAGNAPETVIAPAFPV